MGNNRGFVTDLTTLTQYYSSNEGRKSMNPSDTVMCAQILVYLQMIELLREQEKGERKENDNTH